MKKVVVAIAIALTTVISVNAQELYKNEVDDFTGATKRYTKEYNIAEGKGYKLSLQVANLSEEDYSLFAMYFKTDGDLGCAGAVGEYVMFKFEDGSVLKYEGVGDVNCGDNPTSMFQLHIDDFEGKTVQKIRLQRSDYFLDYEIEGEYTIKELIEAVK